LIILGSLLGLAVAGFCGMATVWGVQDLDETAETAEPLSIPDAAARITGEDDRLWVRLVGAAWRCDTRHVRHVGKDHETEILLADPTGTVVVMAEFSAEISCDQIRRRPAIGELRQMEPRATDRAEVLAHFPNTKTFLRLCTTCGRDVGFTICAGLFALLGLSVALVWLRSAFWPAPPGGTDWGVSVSVGEREDDDGLSAETDAFAGDFDGDGSGPDADSFRDGLGEDAPAEPDEEDVWRDARGRPFIYADRTRWFAGDQYFKVYVSADLLAGAFIAGQFAEPVSAGAQGGIVIQPYVEQCLLNRLRREARYEASDPFARWFLDMDRRNFHILRTDVASVRVSETPSPWYRTSVGTVEIRRRDGSSRKFVLFGEQAVETVAEALRAFDPGITVTSDPTAAREAGFQIAAGVFIVVGLFVLALALVSGGDATNPNDMRAVAGMGALFMLVGLGILGYRRALGR